MNFRRPTLVDIDYAISASKRRLGEETYSYFQYRGSSCFERISIPKNGDWLAEQPEFGQTYDDYKRYIEFCSSPTETKRTMYIQPIGEFHGQAVVPLEVVQSYLTSFFHGLSCEVLPIFSLSKAQKVTRIRTRTVRMNRVNVTQLHTRSVTDFLRTMRSKGFGSKDRIEKELLTIAVTHPYDLFPEDGWNYVFGEADISQGLGVYSFARFYPSFPNLGGGTGAGARGRSKRKRKKSNTKLIMKRSLNTVTHEIGHLLGLSHCIYFNCLMNGSNHLEESDRSPLFMCPVCLRKLHHNLGNGVDGYLRNRYAKMREFYEENDMDEQVKWIDRRNREVFTVQ